MTRNTTQIKKYKRALLDDPKPRTLRELAVKLGATYNAVSQMRSTRVPELEGLWPQRTKRIDHALILALFLKARDQIGASEATRVEVLWRADLTHMEHINTWKDQTEIGAAYREAIRGLKPDKKGAFHHWWCTRSEKPETKARRQAKRDRWHKLMQKHGETCSPKAEREKTAKEYRDDLREYGNSVVGRIYSRSRYRSRLQGANERANRKKLALVVAEYVRS